MYSNEGFITILSDDELVAHRVVGLVGDEDNTWEYTPQVPESGELEEDPIIPIAITVDNSAAKTSDGKWLTSAKLFNVGGIVEAELAPGSDIAPGDYLFACDNGMVTDINNVDFLPEGTSSNFGLASLTVGRAIENNETDETSDVIPMILGGDFGLILALTSAPDES
jgi:hypothetical protein